MRRIVKFYGLAMCMLICLCATAQANTMSAQFAQHKVKQLVNKTMTQQANTAAVNTTIGPVDNYGFLTGPDGSTWTYTAEFTLTDNHYSGVEMTIYDNNYQVAGRLNETFELKETDLWVNTVEINPLVSRKFYNFDNSNIEIVLFIHVATKDYKGRTFNNVYTLSPDSSEFVCTIEGSQVLAKNIPSYNNEKFTMVYFRQTYKGDTLYYNYDVYTKAKYGESNPVFEHTFEIPYQNIAALNDPQPIYMVENGANVNFFVAQYEKPYFVPGTDIYSDPVVNENNSLIITQYDHKYKVMGETKIPMVKNPDPAYLYTFYYLGSLSGESDIIMDYNGTGKPAFVITQDNYEIASDGSVHSFYFYDNEGKLLNTIIEESLGTIYLSDVAGHERQYGFFKNENDVEFVQMVNVPSCETTARISLYNGGVILSGNWDRVAKGNSYQYAVSLLQGNSQDDGSVVQRIAWFNSKGKLDHYDGINLGQKVEYAQVYIYAPVLNPRLFDTDDAYEYMALVKRTAATGSAKEEVLMVCNNEGKTILELGKDETHGALNMIDVINMGSNPALLCTYSSGDEYTLNYYALPLSKSPLKGEGTAENPYQITCASDFMQIEEHPKAYFDIVNDIDFGAVAFATLDVPFGGKLDGNGHKLSNLTLVNGGLFASVEDTAAIENLILDAPVMILTNKTLTAGFVADFMRGGFSDEGAEYHALMKNVHLQNAWMQGQEFTGIFGGLIGEASLFTEIVACSSTGAQMVAHNAERMGGLVGTLYTASNVHACVVEGQLEGGEYVGGIAGEVSDDNPIYDCHVSLDIAGMNTVGGIVGLSARSLVNNCLVEGEASLLASVKSGNIGGVVGYLDPDLLGTSTKIVVENCLVGLDAITCDAGAEMIAHRIVGFSRVNSFEYDWDNIDYSKPQAEWPRIYGNPETCLKDNYVISELAALDATIALTDTTTEGANLAASEMTADWLAAHGYVLGNALETPWVLTENGLLLWFEKDGINTDVKDIWTDNEIDAARKVVIDGQVLIIRDGKMYSVMGYRI